jgi:Mg2+-importing ATPase
MESAAQEPARLQGLTEEEAARRATQTLVVFVSRTAGNTLRIRPSPWPTSNTLLIVAVGVLLPVSPLAGLLGFKRSPPRFFVFLVVSTVTYLLLVEAAKRLFFSRAMDPRPGNGKAAA